MIGWGDHARIFLLYSLSFWEEISGDPELYRKILGLLADKADEQVATYKKAYEAALNQFLQEFQADFATAAGEIDWDKLLAFKSGKKSQTQTMRTRTAKNMKYKGSRGAGTS